MDRVEAALAKIPCVGDLSRWDRRYYYPPSFESEEAWTALEEQRDPEPSSYDRNFIEIDLREAGFEEFGRGRKSYSNYPPGAIDTDDRSYRIAYGSYDVKSGKLDLAACGPNMTPP